MTTTTDTRARPFWRARARAALSVLIVVGVVTAIAAALVVTAVGAVRMLEAREAVAAVGQAGDDRGAVFIRSEGEDLETLESATIDALASLGVAGALRIEREDERLVLRPDGRALSGSAVVALVSALPSLQVDIESRIDGRAQVSGGLRATLASLIDGIQLRQGTTAVALGIVGLIALAVVAAAAIEPVRTRAGERALLRARGASRALLVGIALRESAPVITVGALFGAVGGAVLTRVAGGVIDLLLVGAVTLSLSIAGLIAVVIATMRGVDRTGGRSDIVTGVSSLFIAAVVTAVAVWQFLQAPSLSLPGGAIDPLVVAAPALMLGVGALLAFALSAPLGSALAAAAARFRGANPVTSLRFAARRPGRHALTTAVVAFTTASSVLAIGYQGALTSLGDTPETVRVGADVRVTNVAESTDLAALSTVSGIEQTMAVRSIAARSADGVLPILAVESSSLGSVMLDPTGTVDPAMLDDLVNPSISDLAIPMIPASARSLDIRLQVPPGLEVEFEGQVYQEPPTSVIVAVHLVDAAGTLRRVRATNDARHSDAESGVGQGGDDQYLPGEPELDRTMAVELPAGGPWSVVAIDAMNAGSWSGATVRVSLSAGDEDIDVSTFIRSSVGGSGAIEASGTSLSIEVSPPDPRTGVAESTRAVSAEVQQRLPAVVSADVLELLGLSVGDALSLRMASFSFTVDTEIVGAVSVLPGAPAGSGILVDLTAFSLASPELLVPNEMWISTADPLAVAAGVALVAPEGRIDMVDAAAGRTALATSTAFIVTAFGVAVLAVVVLLLRRSRGGGTSRELGILAAIGWGSAAAARALAAENAFAVLWGALLGSVVGAVSSVLVVPTLVRSAYLEIPGGLSTPLVFDPLVTLAAVSLLAAAFTAIVWSVRAPRSLAPLLREDE